MSDQSILCIGLDAACFEHVNPLLEQGEMPNLEHLINSGISSKLRTTTPPWTPSAWSSITTGTTPWTHGIYDFYDHTTDEPHLVSATDLRVPYLWEYLDQVGHRSIVINVPVTHPVHRFSGSLVPGYLAPEDTDILINSQLASQSRIHDDYRIYAQETHNRNAKIEENETLIDSRVAAAKTLADSHDWSFMMVQFQRTDSIMHTNGHDAEAVRRVYHRVDDAIGSLLDVVEDDTTVIVVSDHGIHEYERTFRCNTWLRDEGWLETSTDSERHAWGELTKPTGAETPQNTSPSRRIITAALTALQYIGLTPRRAERALSLVGLAEPVRQRLPDDLILDAAEHVDWQSSQAYCRSVSSLGIRCNVAGRDSNGIIPQSKFSTIRAELIRALRTVRAPDGTSVFEEVYDRHERHGSDVANEGSAPDIVVRPNDMVWKVTDVIREPVIDTTNEFSHKYEGLFVAVGPPINPAANIDPEVVDIAPMILELFGFDPPQRLDGEVPPGLLDIDRDNLAKIPDPRGRTYLTETRSKSSEVVTDRLKKLGYLE